MSIFIVRVREENEVYDYEFGNIAHAKAQMEYEESCELYEYNNGKYYLVECKNITVDEPKKENTNNKSVVNNLDFMEIENIETISENENNSNIIMVDFTVVINNNKFNYHNIYFDMDIFNKDLKKAVLLNCYQSEENYGVMHNDKTFDNYKKSFTKSLEYGSIKDDYNNMITDINLLNCINNKYDFSMKLHEDLEGFYIDNYLD